jgi:hypothetical protein
VWHTHWFSAGRIQLSLERFGLYRTTNKGIIMNWIKQLWNRITLEIRYRKKLKELRKRDPFIYK